MADNVICNVCSEPSQIDRSSEQALVSSNVRQFSSQQFTVWRCSGCGSLHSKEDVDLDSYYKCYPFKDHSLDFFTRVGYRNRLKLMKKSGLKQDDFILDYGCGEGVFVQYLNELGYINAFGYDPYSRHFSETSSLARKYDYIVSYDVIEHVAEPRDTLKELLDYLRPNGKLLVGTPNASALSLSDPARFAMELHQPYHRHILSEDALLDLAREIGFRATMVTHRFYFDTPIPPVNTRFIWSYVREMGNCIDTVVEPLQPAKLFRSPKLLFYGFFGYFFPVKTSLNAIFEKANVVSQRLAA